MKKKHRPNKNEKSNDVNREFELDYRIHDKKNFKARVISRVTTEKS